MESPIKEKEVSHIVRARALRRAWKGDRVGFAERNPREPTAVSFARRGAKRNAFYAQSGGVTAVINASAAGVIETARAHKDRIGRVYAGANGILGALREELIDTAGKAGHHCGPEAYSRRRLGSCRYKLKSLSKPRRV